LEDRLLALESPLPCRRWLGHCWFFDDEGEVAGEELPELLRFPRSLDCDDELRRDLLSGEGCRDCFMKGALGGRRGMSAKAAKLLGTIGICIGERLWWLPVHIGYIG
jgi:hypothetical protein